MPSGVMAGGTPERRGSTSSEGSGAGSSTHTRSLSGDEPEYVQAARTRMAKVTPPKPAANPLQFIKVGPCDLYKSAQEQLKKAEEVRKTKEVKKVEQEDWQSNLDNWKSSRRKRVEHIIERCVEVKRLTEDDHDRQRRKSKTFSEMMEDRAGRRNGRLALPIYCEDDNNDLSDLGIGTSSASGKSSLSEDCDNHSLASDGMDLDKNHSDLDNMSNCDLGIRKLGSSANEYDTCTTATISSPEPEEYTYEGAIQSYKSRVISRTQITEEITIKHNGTNSSTKEKSPDNYTNGVSQNRRHSLGNKIENTLSTFEQRKTDTVDSAKSENTKKDLPKVDILKRRELFEKEISPESVNGVSTKPAKPNGDILNTKSLKERLSNLEKVTVDPSIPQKNNVLPLEASSLKDRLSSLEKHITESDKCQPKLSNGDLSKVPSVRDRLSSLKANNVHDKLTSNHITPSEITQTIKERLSNLDSLSTPNTSITPEKEVELKSKQNGFDDTTYYKEDSAYESHHTSSERNSSPESGLYDSKRFHRSLDSLDADDNIPGEKFERIQSADNLSVKQTDVKDNQDEKVNMHINQVVVKEDIVNLPSSGLHNQTDQSQDSRQVEVSTDQSLVEIDNSNCKEDVCAATSVAEDDPPTIDENSEIFFDREEEDTVKSIDPDVSVIDALDIAFEAIDMEETQPGIPNKDLPRVQESLNILKPKKMEAEKPAINHEIIDVKNVGEVTSKPVPLYENIDLLYSNVALAPVSEPISFTLGPSVNTMEPPKEKPPPPPVDDEENPAPFVRLNSTKRIKKEIRNKRSSFLGIEGTEDDSYLEPTLKLAPRPDITSFLQEESRVEKMLYRKTLYYDSDSNLGESRDSGVELDRGQSDDTWSNKQNSPETLSEQHSRQGSEPFTNTSVTSEEDENNKKETDFIDGHDSRSVPNHNFVKQNSYNERQEVMGQQLTDKLMKLEQEKLYLENKRNINGDLNKVEEDNRIRSLEEQIREQQNKERCDDSSDDGQFEEVLRVERELLQLEQEELKRQRDNLIFRENQAKRGISLQDINMIQSFPVQATKESSTAYCYAPPVPAKVNYRQSMPDLAMKQTELSIYAINNIQSTPTIIPKTNAIPKKLPPPVPPVKPNRSAEMQERDINVRNSRIPSADSDQDTGVVLRQKPTATQSPNSAHHHQMSRHTLHALSAAPRSRLIPAAEWLQPKRRSDVPQNYDYNNHWLIQEAEQRRIDQLRSNIKKQNQANPQARSKHLPDAVIQTLTQRVQNMSVTARPPPPPVAPQHPPAIPQAATEEKMLSVSGKKKCSHCGEELGRGAAMIIESLGLFYHLSCFNCCVCGVRLGDGRLGADVRVRHNQLHCHNCYSSDDGVKFSCV